MSKILIDTNEFKKRSIAIHGDRYNYDKSIYNGAKIKITITCKTHGDFEQIPGVHYGGRGCVKCSGEEILLNKNKKFIKECMKIHGNRYSYDKTIFKNSHTKVTITCKIHAEFQQLPYVHISGAGCDKCAQLIRAKKKTIPFEQFLEQAVKVHGYRYKYLQNTYVNMTSNITIICNIHGEFKQLCSSHISGSGCNECGNISIGLKKRSTQEDVIKKFIEVHNNKYDYSSVVYVHMKEPVIIICNTHGEFKQTPDKHIAGSNCPKCSKVYKMSNDEFITKVKDEHGEKYDYTKTQFVNMKTLVIITCKTHGDFEQNANSHILGRGCPICKQSHGERIIVYCLNKFNIIYQVQKTFDKCKYIGNLRFDFYIPEYNLCIEYDGVQHFEMRKVFGGKDAFTEQQIKDEIKTKFCKENNIELLRIPYFDKHKIEKILYAKFFIKFVL